MSKGIQFKNKNNEKIYPCPYLPIGSIYRNTNNKNPSECFGVTWSLIRKSVLDTGWRDFTWKNTTYQGTSQSSYTLNKWKVKDNILHIHIGAGATAVINTSTEYEIARIPIKGNASYDNSSKRVWNGAVGGSGAVEGFMIMQNSDYLSVYIKPHTTSNNHTAPWYSTYFAVLLDDNFSFTSGSYETEYIWKRTS